MESFLASESLIIVLLLVITSVAWVGQRLRVPYTIALVLVGLALTFRPGLKPEITPELILALFVPPLAFEAAFHIELRELRQHLLPILTFAVPGVVLAMVIVGGALSALAAIPFASAAVFGALISATDPVAVVALFRSFHIDKRLAVIVESESLLNDGTAIVVFNIALLTALTGAFNPLGGAADFIRVAVGGVAVGAVLGWIVARLIAQVDDYLIETTLTTCLAFGAYLVAEQAHFSGVLAVVVAGLLSGNLGPEGMSPTTKIVLFNFWEYVAFVANSLVFLLIGLTTNVSELLNHLGIIAVAVGAVLLSRLLVVYGLSWLLGRARRPLPLAWQNVIFWGGLRGAVSLALALSLPAALAERDTLRVMTFGVVLFTLLIQGLSMPLLLKRLGLVQQSDRQLEHDTRWGRLYAAEAGWRRLRELRVEGLLTGNLWHELRSEQSKQRRRLARELHTLYEQDEQREQELKAAAQREGLRAERAALAEAARRGLISQDAYRALLAEVDHRLEEPEAPR